MHASIEELYLVENPIKHFSGSQHNVIQRKLNTIIGCIYVINISEFRLILLDYITFLYCYYNSEYI